MFIFKSNLNILFTCVAIYAYTQNMYNSNWFWIPKYWFIQAINKNLKYADSEFFFSVFPEALEVRIVSGDLSCII